MKSNCSGRYGSTVVGLRFNRASIVNSDATHICQDGNRSIFCGNCDPYRRGRGILVSQDQIFQWNI